MTLIPQINLDKILATSWERQKTLTKFVDNYRCYVVDKIAGGKTVMGGVADSNVCPDPDELLCKIADYVCTKEITSEEAYETAFYCLMDSLGCAVLALGVPECRKMLGPVVPGTVVPGGVRVPGTNHVLDPLKGAFDIGVCIRWLDYNDTWLAAEFGHPSDNLGALLSVMDYLSQLGENFSIRDLLTATIKAYEIQGVLALENSFNRVGLDHVLLVKVASTAVSTALLGGSREDVINALTQAWVDGQSLRTYRHAPNTGSRKSWAAGDATRRGLQLAMLTLAGEMGYPTALTAKKWGFQDVLFKGQPVVLAQPLDSYVMEHVLFKISFPAEFHAQTAAEAAIALHPQLINRLEEIDKIKIKTQESAIRIISKTGKLRNFADRDHCLQYIVAVGLLYGELRAEHYGDEIASEPCLDALREKMIVEEEPRYSREYLEADKRSIANQITVFLKNGETVGPVEVEYPVGHKRRRSEGIPLLRKKFEKSITGYFGKRQAKYVLEFFNDRSICERRRVTEMTELLRVP